LFFVLVQLGAAGGPTIESDPAIYEGLEAILGLAIEPNVRAFEPFSDQPTGLEVDPEKPTKID
jgi:hypothetical protein